MQQTSLAISCGWDGGAFCKLNTMRLGQNGCLFTEDIFKCILINENHCIATKISLKYIHMCPINNNPALVQIMALTKCIWKGCLQNIGHLIWVFTCLYRCETDYRQAAHNIMLYKMWPDNVDNMKKFYVFLILEINLFTQYLCLPVSWHPTTNVFM